MRNRTRRQHSTDMHEGGAHDVDCGDFYLSALYTDPDV